MREVGVTFWSGRGHFFVIIGMSWEVPGSGLGMFLDRFGKVLENMSGGVRKVKFSKIYPDLSVSEPAPCSYEVGEWASNTY